LLLHLCFLILGGLCIIGMSNEGDERVRKKLVRYADISISDSYFIHLIGPFYACYEIAELFMVYKKTVRVIRLF